MSVPSPYLLHVKLWAVMSNEPSVKWLLAPLIYVSPMIITTNGYHFIVCTPDCSFFVINSQWCVWVGN
jgi:hypothetical protein